MTCKSLTQTELDNIHEIQDNELWIPREINETIEGVVKEVKKGKYDKKFLKIKDENDTIWVTNQCKSLDEQIKNLQIEDDDIVRVEYNGRLDDEYGSHNYLLMKWTE